MPSSRGIAIEGDCPEQGQVVLRDDFGYTDSRGIGWQAAAGNCTDGASIPVWARPIVGPAFAEDVIRAAVIHDHYCDRRVRHFPETNWVFYDALRASGVPRGKAMTMYFAVMAGGPKWMRLITPKECTIGMECIMQVPVARLPDDATGMAIETGVYYALRDARYEDAKFLAALADVAEEFSEFDDAGITEEEEAALLADLRSRAYDSIGRDSAFIRFGEEGMLVDPELLNVAVE